MRKTLIAFVALLSLFSGFNHSTSPVKKQNTNVAQTLVAPRTTPTRATRSYARKPLFSVPLQKKVVRHAVKPHKLLAKHNKPVTHTVVHTVRKVYVTPKPVIHSVSTVSTGPSDSVWDRLVACESPDRGWRYGAPDVGIDPGYYFFGGPNFTEDTWLSFGGGAFAHYAYDATREQQIIVAKRVLAVQGVMAWPICGPKVGLTRADAYR